MLLQFSCSNYRSIKDRITFSMIASKDKTASERLKSWNDNQVVRTAAVYGPNGSGKSNFISAIEFAKILVVNSLTHQPGAHINQMPHKLLGESVPSTFNFQFVTDDIRYAYGFSILNGLIDEEYLYYFPRKRKIKIFERKGMQIFPGNKYKNSFSLSKEALKENRLLLTCAANYSSVTEIEKAFLFFSQDLVVYRTNVDAPRTNNWYEYSIELMEKNPQVKHSFVAFLKALDTGITDVKAKTEKVDAEGFVKEMPEPIKQIIMTPEFTPDGIKTVQAKVVYDQFETDLVTEESTGIQKLFQIVCPIFDIIANGKILICDEIETGLHESVVHKIIEMFYAMNPEKFAQLIFTTHDTSLLDADLFRRDQIWFTQLIPETRATDLYSLVEIKNVRKDENIARGYVSGKYGAIPVLNDSFKSFIEDYESPGKR